ncbi:IS30 family transposase [Vandammella animalimorsus]|uniref:IS30 family transposase n=2 Tax=Vandammella animalimorsus TaxID=2029117 RepID=A0A2A2T259_9BURK|nr:IS30 family transposase [Vandammella animalimorsus]PAX15622.1 IS30 family transposase [Vandammella animalimorsus]PAX17619.1 IS30 family transposase [Vandammella animalimorsus]
MSISQTYQHLNAQERAVIMLSHGAGFSVRAIARTLARSPSTISRELRRMTSGPYDAVKAAQHYQRCRLRSRRPKRLQPGSRLFAFVRDGLCCRFWSPQQIAAKLCAMPASQSPGLVSHETIYPTLYAQPRGALKKEMISALRQARPKRGNRRASAASASFVPPELRICNRPEEIEHRLIPGHWEGDFIKGAYNRSAVGALSERKTRLVALCRMDGCTAEDALEGFTRQMKKAPAFMRESLTYDRGSEMACFAELSKRLKMDIGFCDPHAPWQRGSNENTNGLLRQFLPKGMDLSTISQTRLNDIARLLNSRPRQTLGWRTPEEVWTEELEKHALKIKSGQNPQSVALGC